MTLRLRWLAAAALLLPLASACSRSEAGAPIPHRGESPGGVFIPNPRDLSVVAAEPCALLTPQQLNSISTGLQGTPGTTSFGGPECVWRNQKVSIRAAADVTTGQGIDVKLKQPGVERVEVAGYPAGQYGDTDPSNCAVSVGVAPDAELIMDFINNASDKPEHQQACEYVNTLAAMAIENLPPKN